MGFLLTHHETPNDEGRTSDSSVISRYLLEAEAEITITDSSLQFLPKVKHNEESLSHGNARIGSELVSIDNIWVYQYQGWVAQKRV